MIDFSAIQPFKNVTVPSGRSKGAASRVEASDRVGRN